MHANTYNQMVRDFVEMADAVNRRMNAPQYDYARTADTPAKRPRRDAASADRRSRHRRGFCAQRLCARRRPGECRDHLLKAKN